MASKCDYCNRDGIDSYLAVGPTSSRGFVHCQVHERRAQRDADRQQARYDRGADR